MSDETSKKNRTPTAFSVPDEERARVVREPRSPGAFDKDLQLTLESDDPFSAINLESPLVARPRKKRMPLLSIFFAAIGVLVSAAFALWLDDLVGTLFARADWLGYSAIGFVVIAVMALVGAVARELIGLRRLAAVQELKVDAENAKAQRNPTAARTILKRLIALTESMPETAMGRSALEMTEGEIIDPSGLLQLAELELLAPSDKRARQAILAACKRVSVVTAVSPRAIVDLGYVLFEAARLVRTVAEIYGTRPGRIGMLRLFGDVVAHLAVTGSIAVGDGIMQQVVGHGVASRISQRLGEGVINGLMTARIGIAAMDLLRPLPFAAVKRPGVSDFLGDMTDGNVPASDLRQ